MIDRSIIAFDSQEITDIWWIGRIWVLLKVFFWNSLRNTFALVFKIVIAIGVLVGFTLFIVLMQLPTKYYSKSIPLSQNWSAYVPLTSGGSAATQPLSVLSYYLSTRAFRLDSTLSRRELQLHQSYTVLN